MDWLTDPNVMEISDQIEKVNLKMLEKLKLRNDHLAVFFCNYPHFMTSTSREFYNDLFQTPKRIASSASKFWPS
jgi:hypothetical protein